MSFGFTAHNVQTALLAKGDKTPPPQTSQG